MTDPKDDGGGSGEPHTGSFSYNVEDRRENMERLGGGLALLVLIPSFLCFILLKSDTTNVGVGLALWAFVTPMLIFGHVYGRRERPKRSIRRRR